MYAGLIHSYLQAINQGAIPNIENAWTYICQNECHKALQESLQSYDTYIRDILHNKLPLPSQDLKSFHQIAKEQALDFFHQTSTGHQSLTESFKKDLLLKIKQKFALIKQENEKESQRVCENFIQVEFQAIERKLKMNEYGQNLQEFQNDLQLFRDYFMDNGPKTANKEIFISLFLNKIQNEASSFFLKHIQSQNDLQNTLLEQQKDQLNAEITEIKQQSKKHQEILNKNLENLHKEKSELEIKEQIMLENISDLKLENQKLDQELKDNQHQEKLDHQKALNDLKIQQNFSEEKAKELERQMILQNSEFEKERALLDQKIKYFEKYQEEQSQKDTM